MNILEKIIQHKKEEVKEKSRLTPLERIQDSQRLFAIRDFNSALCQNKMQIIAEIKKQSPSEGEIMPEANPAEIAVEYERNGASAISVLTDSHYFGGQLEYIQQVKNVVDIPVLRKDFTVHERDIVDARLMGADAVLLIASALSTGELERFFSLSRELELDALVECHDEAELEMALAVGADLVGVNQRNLFTFEVDQDRAARLAALLPNDVVAVAESGIRSPVDAAALREAGYAAILVGETLVTSENPTAAVAALREAV